MFRRIISWAKAVAVAGAAAMLTFATAHQLLVALAPSVYVGVPFAVILAVPLVAGYVALRRAGRGRSGLAYGGLVTLGLVPHFLLIMAGMVGRTFHEGPRRAWFVAALLVAPVVSGAWAWWRTRHVRASLLVGVGTGLVGLAIGDFQASEVDLPNLGAFVSTVVACLAGGVATAWAVDRWQLDRPRVGERPTDTVAA